MNANAGSEKLKATFCGLLAALLWSSTIAGSRILTENFGGLLTVALIHTTAAVISIIYLLFSRKSRRAIRANSLKYTFGCGAMFVIYIITFYQAVNLAASHEQVVIVGLINYLWPALSLGLSVPLLGHRTSPPALLFANGLAVSGVALAVASTGGHSLAELRGAFSTNYPPYLLALAAALTWALYNNFSRRWGGKANSGAVPVFIIAQAALMSPVLLSNYGKIAWSYGIFGVLLYMAVFPTFLAYFCWDLAERKGYHTVVNSMAYAIPVLSTLLTCLILKLRVPLLTWLGCLLVIIGAALAKLVIVEKSDRTDPSADFTLRAIVGENTGQLREFLRGWSPGR